MSKRMKRAVIAGAIGGLAGGSAGAISSSAARGGVWMVLLGAVLVAAMAFAATSAIVLAYRKQNV